MSPSLWEYRSLRSSRPVNLARVDFWPKQHVRIHWVSGTGPLSSEDQSLMGLSVLDARRAYCASWSSTVSREAGLECKTSLFSEWWSSQAVVLVDRLRLVTILCSSWLAGFALAECFDPALRGESAMQWLEASCSWMLSCSLGSCALFYKSSLPSDG